MALAPQSSKTASDDDDGEGRCPLVSRLYMLAFIIVASLFFMWAIGNIFNDILIKQVQKALDLTRMQSALVQTAFYFGYFTIALPAGWIMTKVGYKNGILIGLCLYALGASLFFPAAEVRAFGFFLFALYIVAAGLAFLETAANPLITVMGLARTAAQRLNLTQSFIGLGGFLAPFIGGAAIFSSIDYSSTDLATMSRAALESWRAGEAQAVQMPYLVLAGAVHLLAAVIKLVSFPPLMGLIADRAGTIQASMVVPMVSFFTVL
jgi:MFS transporter, FHS family, L-fucose permease